MPDDDPIGVETCSQLYNKLTCMAYIVLLLQYFVTHRDDFD